jgi:hypothetical protein
MDTEVEDQGSVPVMIRNISLASARIYPGTHVNSRFIRTIFPGSEAAL